MWRLNVVTLWLCVWCAVVEGVTYNEECAAAPCGGKFCPPKCDDPQYVCVKSGPDLTCQHKPLFPLSSADISVTVVLFFGLALASAGGIGGGGLTVPLLILITGFLPSSLLMC